ncbi:MAG: hypothetical protein KGZ39_04490 [Simkania sp.]|nr:hypothetical protein [Simkania sp.]
MLIKLIIAFFSLSAADAEKLGTQIWENESRGKLEGLTSWNDGEEFASMGINHCIWYPAGKRGPFEETFPSLIGFMQKQGLPIPLWLNDHPPCPWNSKKEFMRDFQSAKMLELRQFLYRTRSVQIQFMAERLDKVLLKVIAITPEYNQLHIKTQFQRLLNTKKGPYLLLDYYNFKGDGTWPTERYKEQGWGLLQVLEEMPGNTKHPELEFAQAARKVLKRRIENAPKEREEERWLKGWLARIKTYE